MSLADVVAEPIRDRFQDSERVHVGLFERRVHAPRRERNHDVVARLLRGFLDGNTTAEDDQVRKRDLLPTGPCGDEVLLDGLQRL